MQHEAANHQCCYLGITHYKLRDELWLEVGKYLRQHGCRGFKRTACKEQPTETYQMKGKHNGQNAAQTAGMIGFVVSQHFLPGFMGAKGYAVYTAPYHKIPRGSMP